MQITTVDADASLLASYKKEALSENQRVADFSQKLLALIEQFAGRQLDTTILTIGEIDGYGNPDSIFTQIYLQGDSVIVQSSWARSSDTLWQYQLINPYLWISDSELFAFDTRSPWVTFAIAVLHAVPTLHPLDEFQLPDSIVIDQGMLNLKDIGVVLSREEYQSFLDSFKGQLLEYGEPESDEGLNIWYEPARKFITFYHD